MPFYTQAKKGTQSLEDLLRVQRSRSRSGKPIRSVRNHCWIGSVQGAIATWSVIGMQYLRRVWTLMLGPDRKTKSQGEPGYERDSSTFCAFLSFGLVCETLDSVL